ncbi:DNA recombination protein RmuC [Candidatus Parcubacteria bacterium]|nr:MAG: DNA recombination protein RmuC [Candidatus Parcubacteria bacterium]
MEIYLIILIIFLIGINLLLVWRSRPAAGNEKLVAMLEKIEQLRQQNQELRQELDTKLAQTHQTTHQHFSQTANLIQSITAQTQKAMEAVHGQSQRIIAQVTEKLTKIDETNKQIINFSSQLQNLQDILKNPKQRGVLGEYFLEETLKNVLPPTVYQMQYKFKDGQIVDAVIFIKKKIIPIDSKFSLENYEKILNCRDRNEREKLERQFKQDLKLRIDETAKYIRPEENTMDFAFMFIPSESIYYDLLVNKVGAVKINTRDLIEYAMREKRVIIVSPTSFLAYLQTVLQGLRALQIEESAKLIKANVEKLSRHLLAYDEFLKKLGSSLSTTVNHYNNAYREFQKIDKDIVKITGAEAKIEAVALDRPRLDQQ